MFGALLLLLLMISGSFLTSGPRGRFKPFVARVPHWDYIHGVHGWV
jgi:hypothetical protein